MWGGPNDFRCPLTSSVARSGDREPSTSPSCTDGAVLVGVKVDTHDLSPFLARRGLDLERLFV